MTRAISSPAKAAGGAVVHLLLAVLALVFLLPSLWMVFAAFDAEATLRAAPPSAFTLDNFAAVLTPETVYVPMWNSVLLCGGAAVVTVAASALAAYPLSRYSLRFRRPFLYTVLFATGLPLTAIMVPVYGMFVQAGLLDSRFATMLFLAASSLPFGIWLTKNFMDGIPMELEEAAWVDGASAWQSLRLLVAPLIAPGMAVVGIFTIVLTWGNFFVPFILLKSPDHLPAAVRIYSFFGQYGSVRYGELAAYSLLYTLPVVALYVAVSKALGGRFNLGGAMKG
ncbi:multiple sugar transport system permease protein [Spinactinospora alkalitolerans]|uniref:Multiple sugar transport system permease protein n=1 Tax=Spinactinospora alkalitolerans TaxID=687207 RepID=A0A852TYL9_9ACTN|nr:carbohydrate ABC transporter permease [Spinactinospora alkalitolerans]NYE49028.1 multiple sugar transport system permease protein [Spinactinospora alkalitolerans]